MRKIKVVVLLVRQLQHGFTKNAKVSPNLTVTHLHFTCHSVDTSVYVSVKLWVLSHFYAICLLITIVVLL